MVGSGCGDERRCRHGQGGSCGTRSQVHDKAPSPYPRTARVNQVLREVVAEALERMADIDDRLRLLTVTSVDTRPTCPGPRST